MTIQSKIVNDNGDAADVRRGDFNGRPRGIIAFSEPIYNWKQRSLLFVDSEGSRDIAVDGSTGGTPEGVHDGTDATEWTAVATVGTWDFASTAQANTGTKSIEALNMSDGDIATISKGSDLDFGGFVSLTGFVYITRFNDTQQEMLLYFCDDLITVGNSVNIMNYVDASTLNTWQKFTIPKEDMGIANINVDALKVEFVVNAGSAPRLYLDDIQIEETGGAKFIASPPPGMVFQFNAIEFVIVNDIASTVADGTSPGLSYDKFIGLTSLTSGISLQRFDKKVPQVSVIMQNLFDILSSTFDIKNVTSDGTNTMVKLRVDLPLFVTMDALENDRIELTVNDDLSSLLEFRAIAIGQELVPHKE